ncbi:MAG TPA: ATP-binding protein [Candidatus Binataceae bacterium]|nr:ATP-binding protein [Candidatus Binataceae bacterium]
MPADHEIIANGDRPTAATPDPAREVARARPTARGYEINRVRTVSEDREGARRVAAGSLIFLAVQFVYIRGDMALPPTLMLSFALRHIANIGMMGLCTAAMLHPRLIRFWRHTALAGCSFIAINGAYSSLLIHAPLTQLFAVIVIAVGSSALLPWNGWWQGAMNAMCAGTFAVAALAAPGGDVDAHFWAVLTGAIAVAQASTVFAERVRRERRGFERKLHESAAKFESVFRHSLDPISILRLTDLKFIDVNDAFLRTSGYARTEVLGRDPFELGMFASADELSRLACDLAGSGKAHNIEMRFRNRAGAASPTLISASILKLGGEDCVLAIMRDIAALKHAEAQIVAASEAAQAATRAKSAFLAGMSHEIRTPMNAMLGMADLLWESRLSAEQREYVRIFRTTGNSMLRLIDDILDLSKVEAGRLTLEVADFDLRETVAGAIEALAVRAREKAIALVCEIDPALPAIATGDALRLRQLLFNIVGNAIKFTEHGSVAVHVRAGQLVGGASAFHFSVTDTGIGIPTDRLREIFDEFTQVDSSTTRKYGGTGLGLAIANRLIQLMGGTIAVQSEVGRGSTFHFVMPNATGSPSTQSEPPAPARSSASATQWRSLRILLAEDAEDNRALIRAYLAKTRHLLETADDGAAAVEKFRAGNYDLVLMDVQMPVMDGYCAAREIRDFERETGHPRTPIYALTAFALRDDAEKSRAAGCDGHLTKPIKKVTLLALLDEQARALGEPPLSAAGF